MYTYLYENKEESVILHFFTKPTALYFFCWRICSIHL